MSWKVRHEGSPRSIEVAGPAQIVEGLLDGHWEPTDEVQAPGQREWVALENHPQFAELIEDLDAPPPRHEDDESRLDMNPLIDVTLVLLIFFILTTSYAALQKSLQYPARSPDEAGKVPTRTSEEVKKLTIQVKASLENGKPTIRIDGEPVEIGKLDAAIKRKMKDTHKNELLMDVDDEVNWDTNIAIQSAAGQAGISRVIFVAKKEN